MVLRDSRMEANERYVSTINARRFALVGVAGIFRETQWIDRSAKEVRSLIFRENQ